MVTSPGPFFEPFFSPRVQRNLPYTLEWMGCSCHVPPYYVEPSFWIDAHIAHATSPGGGLMKGECSCLVHFSLVEPSFGIDAHIAHATSPEGGLMKGECSSLVHFFSVNPSFGIDAHVVHAEPFEAGLMITSFCSSFPDDYAVFWDWCAHRPIGVSLTLLCLSQIFVYNHGDPWTGFLASRVEPRRIIPR